MSGRDPTTLLHAWSAGDRSAGEELMPLVYGELRRRAAACLRRERKDHTLQPTALVNETYLRLVSQRTVAWQNRAHFYALAARMMRRVLVDHARRGNMAKRAGRWARVSLDDVHGATSGGVADVDVLDLHDALSRLATFDARKCQVAELRFFGGLSLEEAAQVLGLSVATVEREWQAARAWLYLALKGADRRDSRTLAGHH